MLKLLQKSISMCSSKYTNKNRRYRCNCSIANLQFQIRPAGQNGVDIHNVDHFLQQHWSMFEVNFLVLVVYIQMIRKNKEHKVLYHFELVIYGWCLSIRGVDCCVFLSSVFDNCCITCCNGSNNG